MEKQERMKESRISVSFPPKVKKELEELAAKHDWSQSFIVREAVKEYLKKVRG